MTTSNNNNDSSNERCSLDLSQTCASVHRKELNELIEYYHESMHQSTKSCAEKTTNQQQEASSTAAVAVIIESPSGTGKTVLIDRFCSYLAAEDDEAAQQQSESPDRNSIKKNKAIVCRGKFEERAAASEPFAPIVQAVNQLLCQLFPPDDDVVDDAQESSSSLLSSSRTQELWQQRLKQGLGTEIAFVEIIFPKLTEQVCAASSAAKGGSSGSDEQDLDIIPSLSIHSSSSAPFSSSRKKKQKADSFGSLEDVDWRFERFRFAFRSFLRIVSTHVPLVFVLDDLHWADPDSLQLIHTLLDDGKQNGNFMFVAASRPMHQYPSLQAAFVTGEHVHVTEPRIMQLANLNTIDIACLLVDLIERNSLEPAVCGAGDDIATVADESTMAFAEAVYQKTCGNSFVIVQLLRILENKKLLVRQPTESSTTTWEWNLDGIGAESSIASDNVTQVMAQCLESIDIRQKHALTTAAIFGVSCFEVTTIVHAMQLLQENIFEASTETVLPLELGHESSTTSSFLDGNCSVDDALDPLQCG
jgi:predicted ATPase